MFDVMCDRWGNRGIRCLKCQKKLVAKEKWVCQECKRKGTQVLKAGAITIGVGLVAAIKSHNKKDED